MYYNSFLETPRLILRGMNQQSYDDLFQNHSDSEIKTILGISEDSELETEKSRYQGGYSTFNITIQVFQLVLKEDMRIIGNCGFHSWAKQHRRAEVFYSLKNDLDKRNGYMSEALHEVLKYGIEIMNLRRIEGFVAVTNPASYLLLEKFGFKQEAKLKHRYLFDDGEEWDYFYSFLTENN